MFYKKDLENLYSPFALGLLGRVIRDGEEAKFEVKNIRSDKITKMYSLGQTDKICSDIDDQG